GTRVPARKTRVGDDPASTKGASTEPPELPPPSEAAPSEAAPSKPPARKKAAAKKKESSAAAGRGRADPTVKVDDGKKVKGNSGHSNTSKTVVGKSSKRLLPPGGTLMSALPDVALGQPVELKHVTGQHKIASELRKADGRYVLGQELGRGGMGIVRLVKDLDIGRKIAMKTLNPDDPDFASLVQPLVEEAQTTGQLQHPNIIPVYELGVLPDGDVFYTMKAVSGMTLKDVLRRMRAGDEETLTEYTERKLLGVFEQICLAMHYAHNSGVVHRDLKPDNVLLGAYGEVLVMDWGIAYVMGRQSMLARPGVVVGTPHYMAPEQARGEIHRVDGRSDIFSLGVMLYEILTLTTPIKTGDTELALEQVRGMASAPRPSQAHGGKPIPAALADAVERAMAPTREDRFPNARMLFDMVESYLEGSAETERRQRIAMQELAIGIQAYDRYMELRRTREKMEHKIQRREQRVHQWDAVTSKRDLWDLKTRFDHMEMVLTQSFSTAINHFHRVLGLVPEQAQARVALAQLYWTRFEQAEAHDDHAGMMYFADQVLKYNDAEGGPLKSGLGHVTARSFPEGAEILLYDFTSGVPDPSVESGQRLGAAPASDVPLEMGLYMLVARRPGYRDARQTLFVRPSEQQTYLLTLKPWAAEEAMVGRAGELDLLKLNFGRALAGRQVRRILITGSDGMGKSRLLTAFTDFIQEHPDSILFMFAECHEAHTLVPWGSLTEAFRIRAGIGPDDGVDMARAKLRAMIEPALASGGPPTQRDRELITHTVDAMSLLPAMTSSEFVPDLPPDQMRERFDRALYECFRLMTRWMPGLLYLSEVEYLDDASARVLRGLQSNLPNSPLAVVGFGSDVSVLTGWDEQVNLTPLPPSAVDGLLRELLKGPLPDGLHGYVMSRSGGVPWLVVDTVRRLAETYEIYSADGGWYLKEDLPAVEQMSMFEARHEMVEDLPERLARVLQWAAVVGDVFWGEILESAGISDVAACCTELVERELIRTTSTSRYPEATAWSFRSLLFREIVYDSIHDELATMHKVVADWMRDRFQGDIREVAELARHVELARDEDWAALLYGQLGDACRDSGCFGLARECYQRALVNTVMDEDRVALEQRLESVKAVTGRHAG
ncbi:MAG: serine/threonine protein kinase, partial [Myxococcota bacterium]